MNVKQLAELLDGIEYRVKLSPEIINQAEESGLVIVCGASDDLIEFQGAIDDELGSWDGGIYWIDEKGILPDPEDLQDNEMKDYLLRVEKAKVLNSLWCKTDKYLFTYETDIPHEKFNVVEGDGLYCEGIVFDINKLSVPTILSFPT